MVALALGMLLSTPPPGFVAREVDAQGERVTTTCVYAGAEASKVVRRVEEGGSALAIAAYTLGPARACRAYRKSAWRACTDGDRASASRLLGGVRGEVGAACTEKHPDEESWEATRERHERWCAGGRILHRLDLEPARRLEAIFDLAGPDPFVLEAGGDPALACPSPARRPGRPIGARWEGQEFAIYIHSPRRSEEFGGSVTAFSFEVRSACPVQHLKMKLGSFEATLEPPFRRAVARREALVRAGDSIELDAKDTCGESGLGVFMTLGEGSR